MYNVGIILKAKSSYTRLGFISEPEPQYPEILIIKTNEMH